MKFIYKLFKQDQNTREGIIATTSGLGIAVNLLIASAKVVLGLIASSIAIISEGINNASDALTSVLTLVGTKLAGKHPDEKHPFGYGRVEYLTGLLIAVLILVTGVEMLISSVKLVIHPEEPGVNLLSIIVVAVSAVIKFLLGIYTVKMGRKAGSNALEAVGVDCRNDAFVSAVTILSVVVFLVFRWNIDAYVGIFMSLIVIKAGFGILKDTVGELLGRPGEKELASSIYREIMETEGIIGAADMMLHNYGPEAYSGSVNIEVDHEKTVGDVYRVVHELQLRIMHEKNVTMVFGIYAVDNDHEEVHKIRQDIVAFMKTEDNVKSYHAVYLEPETDTIYVDFIVDYKLRDWDSLRERFLAYMSEKYPENEVNLTLETEFV